MRLNQPERKSPRAGWHDYNGGEYFVTICTHNREHFFGTIINHKMNLSEIGIYTAECIVKISELNHDAVVKEYVVMPNHIHLILDVARMGRVGMGCVGMGHCPIPTATVMNRDCPIPTAAEQSRQSIEINTEMQRRSLSKGRVSVIIGSFKSAVTKFARQKGMYFAWQTRFHDHIIRNQEEYCSKTD
jgi:hypothetical protein